MFFSVCYWGFSAAWKVWIIFMFMLFVFVINCKKKPTTTDNKVPLPPCGPWALRSSTSDMRVWVWHWLCIPTPECHQ